ncbi:hypothetical protein [Erythrobacter alti]|uniref:hypothetical protein n=1 Tax=Erythrobacter alti TaxID=1896145 RepID=UPI0030F46BA8
MTRTLALTVTSALVLVACQPEQAAEPAPTSASQTDEPPETPVAVPAPETLAGGWRVAGIDGESLDEPYGLALMADEEEIWWEPRCAGMILSYSIEGNAFSTGPRTGEPPASNSTPAPVCAIGLPPRLHDVSSALQLAERIELTPSNGVRISGGGRSVLLYSQ